MSSGNEHDHTIDADLERRGTPDACCGPLAESDGSLGAQMPLFEKFEREDEGKRLGRNLSRHKRMRRA